MQTLYPDHKIELLIGFDFIRDYLANACVSEGGKAKVLALTPTDNLNELTKRQQEIVAFYAIHQQKPIQLIAWEKLSANLKQCEIEDFVLSLEEIVDLKDFLAQAVKIQKNLQPFIQEFPILAQYAGEGTALQQLIAFMDEIIGANGKIKSNASPILKKLVKDKVQAQDEISAVLQRLHKQYKAQNITAETTPTVKNGRYVLPIISAQKNKVEGVVLGESGSKNTSYIEPLEVVRSNNLLTAIETEIDLEIQRLLSLICYRIGKNHIEIYYAQEKLFHLDFLAAINKYQASFKANIIQVSTNEIVLKEAKHPKLADHCRKANLPIVPLNFKYNEEERMMIISGPNAGGKSVALKTLSALQYAFQCGLPIAAEASSKSMMFSHMLVDIGDNQSIDSDLSTYSSHLVAMNNMLSPKKGKVFLAIDEIGAGTDPKLGGPMAEAMILHFNEMKYYGIITTHFSNLKTLTDAGIFNAAMLFDTEKLSPLFELSIGNPGSSFVLELARRLKTPKFIIKKAQELAGDDTQQLDQILTEIDSTKSKLLQSQERISKKEQQLSKLIAEYDTLKTELVKSKKGILDAAKLEASQVMQNANKQIELTVKTIKENNAKAEIVKKEKQKITVQKALISKTANQTALVAKDIKPKPLLWKVGDLASIDNLTQAVEIIAIKKNKVEVVINNIRTMVDKARLFPAVKNKNDGNRNNFSQYVIQKMGAFKTKLDLRGMRELDAKAALQSYLDDAYSLGIKELSVVHGRGDGAIKKMTKELLKSLKYIESWNYDHADRGGDGATMIKLK